MTAIAAAIIDFLIALFYVTACNYAANAAVVFMILVSSTGTKRLIET